MNELTNLLKIRKEAILKRWIELTFDTYPEETKKFLITRKDRFANPVGSTTTEGLETFYDWLLADHDTENAEFNEYLDKIIRIRAVQSFSPSKAVGFIFLIKNAVREAMADEIRENRLFEQLLTFESKVDKLGLLAFNIYMQCRETLYDIRATEIRNRISRILDRACQKYGMPREWFDPEDNNKFTVT